MLKWIGNAPDPQQIMPAGEAQKWLDKNPAPGGGEDSAYGEMLATIGNPQRPAIVMQAERDKAAEDYKDRSIPVAVAMEGIKNSLPVASSLGRFLTGRERGEATDRAKLGMATESDLRMVARQQFEQTQQAQEGTGLTVLRAASHIPAIIGEAAMAAPVVRGLGLSPALLRGSAQAGEVAVSQMPRALGTAMQLGARVAGGTAAQTAMMPSMWLAQSQDRALQNGGNWYDAKNLGPAGAIGMAQVAVLGAISRVPVMAATEYPVASGAVGRSIMADGVQGWVSRMAAGTVTGMTGQQGIDLASKSLGWSTSWGAVPDLLMGKEGGFKHFASQAVVFALFSALHAHNVPKPGLGAKQTDAMQWVKTAAEAYSRNFDGAEAEPAAEKGAQIFSDAMKGTLTREAVDQMPEGPEKDLASKVVDNLPKAPTRGSPEWIDQAARDIGSGKKSAADLGLDENSPEYQAVAEQIKVLFKDTGEGIRAKARIGEAQQTPQVAQDATSPPEAAKGPTPAEAPAEAKPLAPPEIEALAQKVAATKGEKDANALMKGLDQASRDAVVSRAAELFDQGQKPTERWTRQEQQEAAKNLGLNQREFANWIKNNPKAAGDLEGAVVRQRNAPRGPQAIQPEPPPEPTKPGEKYYRVPSSKSAESNVDEAIRELVGKGFAQKWFSRTAEGNEGYFKPGKVQIEFANEHLRGEPEGDFVQRGNKDVLIGAKPPMIEHPALSGIRYRGTENSPDFARLKGIVEDANALRAEKGLKPIELTATEQPVPRGTPVAEPPKAPELTPEERAAEVERLAAEQKADAKAQQRQDTGLPRKGVQTTENEARASVVDAVDRSDLPDRDKAILKERAKGESLRSVAAKFGLSYERVRQIEKAALPRLGSDDASMEGFFAKVRNDSALAERGDLESVPKMSNLDPETAAHVADVSDEDVAKVLQDEFGITDHSREALDRHVDQTLEEIANAIEQDARDAERRGDSPASVRRTTQQRLQALRAKARLAAAAPGAENPAPEGQPAPAETPPASGPEARGNVVEPWKKAEAIAIRRYPDSRVVEREDSWVTLQHPDGSRSVIDDTGHETPDDGAEIGKSMDDAAFVKDALKGIEKENARGPVEPTGRDRFTRLKEEGAARLKKRFGGDTLTSGFDPAAVPELAMYLAGKIGEVGWDLAEFTKFAVARFGETVRPHLKDIWDRAQNLVKRADEPMGAKNSSVDVERADRGLPPIEKVARDGWEKTWDSVKARMQAEPDYAQKLVADYTKRPRAFESEADQAAILYERIRVQNEYDKLLHEMHDSADPDARQQLKLRSAVLADQLQGIDVVLRNGGSATGGVLNARRMMANEDFTLARMTMEKEAALGKKLTPEQEAEVLKQWKKLQELEPGKSPWPTMGGRKPGEGRPSDPAKIGRAKQQWSEELAKDRWTQKPWLEKGADLLTRIRRAFVLSSPVVFAKLNSAAAFRMVFNLGEEGVGAALERAFPGFGAKTMVEGGLNVAAEARAWRTMFTKGMKDAADVARTGKSELDVLHGAKANMPSSWLDLFGQLHGALKAPVKRAFFERGLEKGAAWAIRNGLEPNDPEVGARIATEAFKYAERSIFMQNNRVADLVERSAKYLERPDPLSGKVNPAGKMGAAAIRFALPIVKVPTNIVAETFVSAFGGITGSVSLARAYARGIESLAPEQADSIMRQLKKGSLGGAMLALGYALPGMFGGFHQPDEKRKAGEAGAGEMKVGDTVVPRYLLHNPLLEAAQFGATLRRVADTMTGSAKGPQQQEGTGMGMFRALTGLVEETPMARETVDLSKAFGKDADVQQFAGKNIKSALIPSGVDWAARNLDRPAIDAPVVKRQTKTVGEELQSGIPWYRQGLPVKSSKGLGAKK